MTSEVALSMATLINLWIDYRIPDYRDRARAATRADTTSCSAPGTPPRRPSSLSPALLAGARGRR